MAQPTIAPRSDEASREGGRYLAHRLASHPARYPAIR